MEFTTENYCTSPLSPLDLEYIMARSKYAFPSLSSDEEASESTFQSYPTVGDSEGFIHFWHRQEHENSVVDVAKDREVQNHQEENQHQDEGTSTSTILEEVRYDPPVLMRPQNQVDLLANHQPLPGCCQQPQQGYTQNQQQEQGKESDVGYNWNSDVAELLTVSSPPESSAFLQDTSIIGYLVKEIENLRAGLEWTKKEIENLRAESEWTRNINVVYNQNFAHNDQPILSTTTIPQRSETPNSKQPQQPQQTLTSSRTKQQKRKNQEPSSSTKKKKKDNGCQQPQQTHIFIDCSDTVGSNTKQQEPSSSTQNKENGSSYSDEDKNTMTNDDENQQLQQTKGTKIYERLYIQFPSPDFEVELEVYYDKPEASNFLCKVSLKSTPKEVFEKKHNTLNLKSKLRTEFVSQFKAKEKEKDPNITDEEIQIPGHTKFYLKIDGEMFRVCSKPIHPCVNVIEFDETKKATFIESDNCRNKGYPETIIKIKQAQFELFDIDDDLA